MSLISLALALAAGCAPGIVGDENLGTRNDAGTSSSADGLNSSGEGTLAADKGQTGLGVDAEICQPVCFGTICGADDGCQGTCGQGSGCLRSCSATGVQLSHGESRVFYSQKTAPFGSSCEDYKEQRECTDGTLSGSYMHLDCSVKKIRVLLWNILYAGWEHDQIPHWDDGRKENVIALAQAADADVMLFQEVNPTMFQDLKAAFSAQYQSHLQQKLVGSNSGNAIFSRLSMSQLGGFTVDDRDRNCASAVIGGVNFYSCHLPPPGNNTDAIRIAAANVVASMVKAPLVLGGDFNTQGNLGIYGIVKSPYQGCGQGVNHLFTDQSCSLTSTIPLQSNGWPSDHEGIIFSVPQ